MAALWRAVSRAGFSLSWMRPMRSATRAGMPRLVLQNGKCVRPAALQACGIGPGQCSTGAGVGGGGPGGGKRPMEPETAPGLGARPAPALLSQQVTPGWWKYMK